jgi:enamine deaminase RidA (YjgF/YER057c/UK114 family)|tara:strand:+ start:240 stop:623 length:384 start_codon:yes stop_codon:yes gene_type:complete
MKTAAQLTAIYIRMREAIKVKEDEIKEIKAQQEVVTENLLALCDEQGLDSVKSVTGTVTRRVQANYWTSDWEQMHRFIKEHDALHLLEKRVSNSSMKEFLEEHPDLSPAGLQINRKFVISVRKPTKT